MSTQRLNLHVRRAMIAAALAVSPTVAQGQSAEDFFKTASLSL